MLREFKDFLLKGNLIEVAVALVLALALTAVVSSLVEDLITPLIAAVFGQPDFAGLTFEINDSEFRYGEFFFVVKPVNALAERRRKGEDATTRECPECLGEIPVGARRCAHCTSVVGASS
jgi:large conductance mechanosensitive channel